MSVPVEQHTVEHHEPHVASFGSYIGIYLGLLVLTAATVGASKIPLGDFNVVLAVIIAMIKASVVVLFFMHVKYSSPLIKLTAAAGFVWLLFMFGLTFADYFGRMMIDTPKSWITPAPVPSTPPTAEHKE